jgi:hypothetical protein
MAGAIIFYRGRTKKLAMAERYNAPLNGGALHPIILLTVLGQGTSKGGRP